MSAKENTCTSVVSQATIKGVVCETSTSEEEKRKLKDYFADAATRLNVKKSTTMFVSRDSSFYGI